MKFSSKILAPGILMYENVLDFSEKIIEISDTDTKNWNIMNQSASEWEQGQRVVGYDEYPLSLNFSSHENIILFAKKIYDCAIDYSVKNLTRIDGFDYSSIRRYSTDQSFLELESPDMENPLRKITSILFLNDIEDGGKLTFSNFELSISPIQGHAVVFPSSFAYSFKINRPKSKISFLAISHFV